MNKMLYLGFGIFCLCLIATSVSSQQMLYEDFNDQNLAPGFEFYDGDGFVFPNDTDDETWTIYSSESAWGAWNNFQSSSIASPEFQADEFTVRFELRNIIKMSQSDWDNIAVLIDGLAEDLVIYLGSSADNGELNPPYALYAEIQHPDKDNGYIWDSQVNLGGAEVPSPWSDYIDEFPETIVLEIVFNGPGQVLDIYYNFDNQGRSHLLQWNDEEPSHTFDQVLAKDDTDTYSVTIHTNVGSAPVLSVDIDTFKISGDIQSEHAVADPDFTKVNNWFMFK